jgi:hypothetical protein
LSFAEITYIFVAAQNQPPDIVQANELKIIHQVGPPLGDELVLLAVDGLKEPFKALDTALRHKTRIQLKNVVLEKVSVDFWIEVRLLSHQLGEPLETSLTVLGEHGILG